MEDETQTPTEVIETDAPLRSISQFIAFEKIDKEERLVTGTISSESLDSQNQIVEVKAIEDALADYMKYANIREMHQPSAVGKAQKIWLEDGKWKIIAKIVDDMAWKKVKEGVYNGFSIGGRTKPGGLKKVTEGGKIIERLTAIEMSEISLADRPANGDATFDMWKVAGLEASNENQNQTNQGGDAVMPPEELEIQNQGDPAAANTAAPAETPATPADQVVDTGTGGVAKSALDAAFAAAEAKIEKAVTPPPPAPAAEVTPPAEIAAGDSQDDLAKAAASRAVDSDDTESAAIQTVLTSLQAMRNVAESAGLPRKANLLGSACSAIVYLLAAINEPDREYDYYMAEMIGDLAKSQLAVDAAFTKVARPDPDESLQSIEKAVVDGLAGITDKISGLVERLEVVERQPAPGGPAIRAVEKTLSTGVGGSPAPSNRDERVVAIEALEKMQSETSDPIFKASLGEKIADYKIRNQLGFRN